MFPSCLRLLRFCISAEVGEAVGHTGPEVAGGRFGPRAALTQPTSVSAST